MDNQSIYTKIYYSPKNEEDKINQVKYLLKLHYGFDYDKIGFKNGNVCDLRLENLLIKPNTHYPIMNMC